MKNKSVKVWSILGGGVLFIIGAGLIVLSEFIPNETISNIINEIGAGILISGIMGIIDKYILQESLIELIIKKIGTKEDIDKTGLDRVVTDITDIQYKQYFKSAKKCIDIVHLYGRTWTNNNMECIKERVLNSNCKVRVVLINPSSKFVPALEEHFNYDNGKLEEMIKDVSKRWKELYDKQKNKKKRKTQGVIELYYHNGQPTNSIYRIDDKIIIVQTKTTKNKTTKMPAIIFKDTDKKEDVYNLYSNEIEQLIRESTQVDLDNF